jgi:hypothetical protein
MDKICNNRVENKLIQKLSMKYFYRNQIEKLLGECKFLVNERFGYYDKRSIDEGTEFIFVCKKKSFKLSYF